MLFLWNLVRRGCYCKVWTFHGGKKGYWNRTSANKRERKSEFWTFCDNVIIGSPKSFQLLSDCSRFCINDIWNRLNSAFFFSLLNFHCIKCICGWFVTWYGEGNFVFRVSNGRYHLKNLFIILFAVIREGNFNNFRNCASSWL